MRGGDSGYLRPVGWLSAERRVCRMKRERERERERERTGDGWTEWWRYKKRHREGRTDQDIETLISPLQVTDSWFSMKECKNEEKKERRTEKTLTLTMGTQKVFERRMRRIKRLERGRKKTIEGERGKPQCLQTAMFLCSLQHCVCVCQSIVAVCVCIICAASVTMYICKHCCKASSYMSRFNGQATGISLARLHYDNAEEKVSIH